MFMINFQKYPIELGHNKYSVCCTQSLLETQEQVSETAYLCHAAY